MRGSGLDQCKAAQSRARSGWQGRKPYMPSLAKLEVCFFFSHHLVYP